MEDNYESLIENALNNENYKDWRKEHTRVFGEIFSSAFTENEEAQIHLTSALIHISKRNFEAALPKLILLESICVNEYDCAAVDYFIGLNYEMMENESKMNEYYEKVKSSNISFVFPLQLHPYYRTAKFAQRASECSKALFFYRKALSFYDGATPNANINSSVSFIIYDIATICLYMHEYDECERFLKLSNKFDKSQNQHRTYVTSILYAIQGRVDDSYALLNSMSSFLRQNCEPMIEAILAEADFHYCVVSQDRSGYVDFWNELASLKGNIEELVCSEKVSDAEKIISEKLSIALSFMKRQLACKIELSGDKITVYCKNYYVKTLEKEYEALFSSKPRELNDWHFTSIKEFENY